jgi:tRNA G10  N-methylase Trm11
LYIAGDISPECVAQASQNLKSLSNVTVETFQWNVCRLPLLSGTISRLTKIDISFKGSIDTTITDIPSGRKGSFKKAQKFYPRLFREVTRVVKPKGRAVLLTLEKDLMKKLLTDNIFWKVLATYQVIKYLDGNVIIL